jgi:uncharacterized protein YndB with AHSA1/START domain
VAESDISAELRIAASPARLYDMVSDVTRMGEWSPENVGCKWLGDASGPAVGSRFRGSNRRGWRRWSTTCKVVTAEPGRAFAFDVSFGGLPIARWTYEFKEDGDGTVVTEHWTDRRAGWMRVGSGPVMGVRDMATFNRSNMEKTLAELKAAAES